MADKLNDKLNEKQKIFAEEWVTDYNATQAYIRAGYSPNGARQAAEHLLNNPKVAAYIEKLVEARVARSEVSDVRIMQEIERCALLDVRGLFDQDGNLVQIADMDDNIAACIAGFDVHEKFNGQGKLIGYVKKVKLVDKKGFLELLLKKRGMLTDKLTIQYDLSNLTDEELALLEKIQSKL